MCSVDRVADGVRVGQGAGGGGGREGVRGWGLGVGLVGAYCNTPLRLGGYGARLDRRRVNRVYHGVDGVASRGRRSVPHRARRLRGGRVPMLLLGQESIREVVLFPQLRSR